jgi:hypothetical protein
MTSRTFPVFAEIPVPNTYALVRQAIIDKHQVLAVYQGHHREMCPHVIGTKDGRRQALFFQFAGSSSTGLPLGGEWRCLPIDGLSEAISRSGEWHTRSDYSQLQTCVDVVDVEVEC